MQKGYEMLDNSPEGPKKSYKIISIAIALLVVAGGTVYAVTRNSEGPVSPAASKTTEQATNQTSKPSTSTSESTTATQNNQQTQPATNVAPVTQIVHFGLDSATLLSGEDAKVQEFITKVKDGKGSIQIDGYTDNLGSHAHGVTLSEQRAKTIEILLKQLNLGNQLTTTLKENAEANPIGDNSTLEGRALNRRVEIKFVPK